MIQRQPSLFDVDPESISKKATVKVKGLSAQQLKAMAWFAKTKDLRVELSNSPTQMHFTIKPTGEPFTTTLSSIIDEYDEWNAEDKKERARKARLEREFQKRLKGGLV